MAALVGGAFVAFVYGKKADAHIEGKVHKTPNGTLVIEARPSLHAVGFRKIKIAGGDWASASVRVTEVWSVVRPEGVKLEDGFYWDASDVFGTKEKITVAGGETLTTTTLIEIGPPPPEGVIGWRVLFQGVTRRALWIGGWQWDDRVFVRAGGY